MINKYELRLGVNILKEGKSITVNERAMELALNVPDMFEPIPLTPELLEKCGFITRQDDVFWKHEKQHFWISVEKDKILLQVINPDAIAVINGIHFNTFLNVGNPIKYLHQLQNLFYDLTGEVLAISL